mgnify:FL=1
MKILVTGGSGLVGKAIQEISKEYSTFTFYFLSSSECDLEDYNETYQFFSNYKPDYVIHLAACVGGLYKNLANPSTMLEKNLFY